VKSAGRRAFSSHGRLTASPETRCWVVREPQHLRRSGGGALSKIGSCRCGAAGVYWHYDLMVRPSGGSARHTGQQLEIDAIITTSPSAAAD